MSRVARIRQIVSDLYAKKNPVIGWNAWVFEEHVEVVAHWVRTIAKQHPCKAELAEIAAYLHDIGYAWTDKNDPTLDEQSLAKARKILEAEGFSTDEIVLIVEDAIAHHSASDGVLPASIEGRILCTADALAHFTTDFYMVICWHHYLFERKSLEEFRAWVLKKIERDFTLKIAFDEYRKVAEPSYIGLKLLFGRKAKDILK